MSLVLLGISMSITPDLPEAYIEKKYTNNTSKFMWIDDLKVHYRDEGQGMPIVLIHVPVPLYIPGRIGPKY